MIYDNLYKQEEGKDSIIVLGIGFLCLWLCVTSWHVYSAVDLGLMLSGFGPQIGNAARAELLCARPLWPLPHPRPLGHGLHTPTQRNAHSFCPWVIFPVLTFFPVLAVRALRVLFYTPAHFVRGFITVSFYIRPCNDLALKFQLPSHLGPAVLKPNLETKKKVK